MAVLLWQEAVQGNFPIKSPREGRSESDITIRRSNGRCSGAQRRESRELRLIAERFCSIGNSFDLALCGIFNEVSLNRRNSNLQRERITEDYETSSGLKFPGLFLIHWGSAGYARRCSERFVPGSRALYIRRVLENYLPPSRRQRGEHRDSSRLWIYNGTFPNISNVSLADDPGKSRSALNFPTILTSIRHFSFTLLYLMYVIPCVTAAMTF